MTDTPVKKVRKPKKQKVKQGHKLVWLTLIIILVPVLIVGFELYSSAQSSNKPVIGSRFKETDLKPTISEEALNGIQGELMNIDGVESATVNLKSATLRIHLNFRDDLPTDHLINGAEVAYGIVNNYLPIETYFTNAEGVKNYDLEIDAYNYQVDDAHPAEGQIFIKIVKNGAGQKVVENLTEPRNAELAQQVKEGGQAPAPAEEAPAQEEAPAEEPAQ
ncbi:MAG: hypothetical protein HUJ54_08125 [Erysipelotrichaceae bacterium]|nr:hypothetical protein [Erysipelotrichaceae bacterium]